MAMRREDFVMRGGFELVIDGLNEDTRRSPDVPREWKGLTSVDRRLLDRWMDEIRQDVLELHTDVPVGIVPEVDGGEVSEFIRTQIASSHPLRIDACVLRSTGWLVAEMKPDAGYKALGQVLSYSFWAPRCCGVLHSARAVVVTDRAQEAIRPVYEFLGVGLIEVGGPEEEEE